MYSSSTNNSPRNERRASFTSIFSHRAQNNSSSSSSSSTAHNTHSSCEPLAGSGTGLAISVRDGSLISHHPAAHSVGRADQPQQLEEEQLSPAPSPTLSPSPLPHGVFASTLSHHRHVHTDSMQHLQHKPIRYPASAPSSPNRPPPYRNLFFSLSFSSFTPSNSSKSSKLSLQRVSDECRHSLLHDDEDDNDGMELPRRGSLRLHSNKLLSLCCMPSSASSSDSCFGRCLLWRWRWAALWIAFVSLVLSTALVCYMVYYTIHPHGHLCPMDLTPINSLYAQLAQHHLLTTRGYHLTPHHSITPHIIHTTQHSITEVNITRFRWDTRQPHTWRQRATGSPAEVRMVGLGGEELPGVPAHSIGYVRQVQRMLQEMVDHWQPRDQLPPYMDILINTDYGDQLRDRNGSASSDTRPTTAPIFSSCSTLTSADVPFIYAEAWKPSGVYRTLESQLLKTLAHVPESAVTLPSGEQCRDVNAFTPLHWATKLSTAIWRGSTTGGLYTPTNYESYPRYQLAKLSQQSHSTGLIDAKLTHCTQCEPIAAMETLLRSQLTTHFQHELITPQQLTHYRALIDVDGNSWSSRLPQLLASGATVLKQASPYREFWYDLAESGVQWVEVARDLSDLEGVAEAVLRRGGGSGGEVAVNALRFARQYLTEDAVRLYAQHLLKAYAVLLEVPPTVPTAISR